MIPKVISKCFVAVGYWEVANNRSAFAPPPETVPGLDMTFFPTSSAIDGHHASLRCAYMMLCNHYHDVIMSTITSQITSLTVVYSIVYSDADQRKHQSSASLAFVWGIHRGRWIPRTKGQLRGKCFHLMTSSWYQYTLIILLGPLLLTEIIRHSVYGLEITLFFA